MIKYYLHNQLVNWLTFIFRQIKAHLGALYIYEWNS